MTTNQISVSHRTMELVEALAGEQILQASGPSRQLHEAATAAR